MKSAFFSKYFRPARLGAVAGSFFVFSLGFLAGPASAATAAVAPVAVPPALRPALYQALANDAGPAYTIDKKGCAKLAKPALQACFATDGAHFTGAQHLSLHLAAFGRGTNLDPVITVRPDIKANQARYRYGNLTEWWRVLPMGFEQGFTIAKRPAGHGKLTLMLTASRQHADASATRHSRTSPSIPLRSEGGKEIAWGKLRYGKLVVTDAKGKVIPATMTAKGDRILIAVNDARATYPLTVDPLVWAQQQKLTTHDGAENDFFGDAIAIDPVAGRALIAASDATVNGKAAQGAVYLFTETDGVWSETSKLVADDGAGYAGFGLAVALAGDQALVGAPYTTVNGNAGQGAAYVFTINDDGSWTQTKKLTDPTGEENEEFGWSVAISYSLTGVDDYNYFTGAPGATVNGQIGQGEVIAWEAGAAGEPWNGERIFANDGAQYDEFGYAVASDDYHGVLIGAVFANSNHGKAYIFNYSTDEPTGWFQYQELIPGDTDESLFGSSFAVHQDYPFEFLVGAPGENVTTGSVYVFKMNDGGVWEQDQKLTLDGEGTGFGTSIASDGTNLVIGAPYVSTNGNAQQGAAYVFSKQALADDDWVQEQEITASDGEEYGGFGVTVALLDGANLLVGAPYATVNGAADQGATYYFTSSDAPPVASDGTLTAIVNTTANGTLVATDPNGDTLEYSILESPQHGDVVLEDPATGAYRYTPNDDYYGPDSFPFKANDGTRDSNTATITITVYRPPEASDGTLTTDKNTAASGTLDATDPDGSTLDFSIVDEPGHGSVTLDDVTTGAYTYTPAEGYTGSDSFTFKANDGRADSNVATVHVTVKGSGNNAPVALNGSFSVDSKATANYSLQASDPDGDPITYHIVSQPKYGTLTLADASSGSISYKADSTSDDLTDSFTFMVTDGDLDSNTATVTVKVSGGGGFAGIGLGLLAFIGLIGLIRRRR